MKSLISILLLWIITFNSVAQVKTKFSNNTLLGESGFFGSPMVGPTKELRKFDLSRVLQQDSLEKSLGFPYRFGYAIDVNYNTENSGKWFEKHDGRIWKLKIKSKGAYSINLIFDQLLLPDGGMLFVYNENRTMIYGPVTAGSVPDSGKFGTDLIQGDLITLELFEPKSAANETKLKISKAVHGYKNMFATPNNFGDSYACNNDINCPEGNGWQNPSDGVAMVLLDDGQRFCSGLLLNNACQDFTPNFLTAFHCIDIGNNANPCETEAGNGSLSAAEIDRAEDWVFRFQYKSPLVTGRSRLLGLRLMDQLIGQVGLIQILH